MQLLPGGDMLAVMLPEKVQPRQATLLAAQRAIFVRGFRSAVMQAESTRCGVSASTRPMPFIQMEPILGQFTEQVKNKPSAPKNPTYPTGTWITAKEATDPSYLRSRYAFLNKDYASC